MVEEGGGDLHQTIPHRRRRLVINSILSSGSEEVSLLDFIRPDPLCDPDHPQEFVDVVARVPK